MSKQYVVICGGAPQPALHLLDALWTANDEVHWIGADRGALALIEAGYQLDLAVGDFDSVGPTEKARIQAHSQQVHQYPSEKDDTDGHLALDYAMQHWPHAHYYVLGFLGEGVGRLDHALANIWLAHQPRFRDGLARLTFLERHHRVCFLEPGHHQLAYQSCYYLSLVSLTPVSQLTIEGAKYTLATRDFATPQSLISNEYRPTQEPVLVSFTEGLLMVLWVTTR